MEDLTDCYLLQVAEYDFESRTFVAKARMGMGNPCRYGASKQACVFVPE